MVATRRGVRVYSPTRSDQDQVQSSGVPATPSTGRRTRSSAKRAESPTQQALVETSSQLEKIEERPQASPHPSPLRRCTRASRLHSPEQPCTPASSSHEADVSDRESCCSVVSDVQPSVTRSRGRRQPRTVIQEDEEISEVESCSSAASVSRVSQSAPRSTRKKTVPKNPDTAHNEEVTRSQRRTRSSARATQQTEDSELSDADSCVSSVSGVSRSTTRRPTRSRSQRAPIPFALEEASESSEPLPPRAQRSRAARGKAAAAVDVSEPQSCDSEGFESGSTYSMRSRRRGQTQSTGPKALDSGSEQTDVHSPMGRGTPCSSRTGSGSSSSRAAPITRTSVRDCHIFLEKTRHPAEDSLNDSRLESTVIAEDADCTLVEGDESQPLEEEKGDVNRTDVTSNYAVSVEKGVTVISEDPPLVSPLVSDSPGCAEEAVSKPAVIVQHQQEEPCAQNEDGNVSEEEMMQETSQTSEPLKPLQPTVTSCGSASEPPEEAEDKHEAMEAADEAVEAVVETRPSEEEEDEEEEKVTTLHEDAQQVVDSSDVHVESIQVTSSQQHNVTVESDPEQQTKDVIVQKAKIISLLESSEDEDEDDAEEDERDVSGVEEEEDLELQAEERAGPSQRRDTAAASVDGLFMIDTRPGQEADEQYYQEKPREEEGGEQEEQDEEFVDEEGDDDDDEEAEILFSSRNPQLKELSSRIDPGFRVKELGGLYINFDGSKSKPVSSSLQKQKLKEKKSQDEVMKKSVMGPDFEKKDAVPPYRESKKALKLKHRTEREKSTGDAWFNMKAPEITQELKGDLQVLKMRGSLDPKRFYKKNDRDGFPKYFQVGTVVDNAVDFYHSRVPKKARKRTMVEELLADAEFRQNNKKKYQHIVMERAAQGAGRRNKMKKKFHKK